MDDPTGIGWVQADELSRVRDRLAVGDQGEELPAAGFDQVRRLACAPTQVLRREMGVEGESTCHAAAYHSSLTSCGLRITPVSGKSCSSDCREGGTQLADEDRDTSTSRSALIRSWSPPESAV